MPGRKMQIIDLQCIGDQAKVRIDGSYEVSKSQASEDRKKKKQTKGATDSVPLQRMRPTASVQGFMESESGERNCTADKLSTPQLKLPLVRGQGRFRGHFVFSNFFRSSMVPHV